MAIQAGELIESESEKDKEFHFLLLHHADTVIIEGKSYRMKDQTEE